MAAAKRQGVALAGALDKSTRPCKNGKTAGTKTTCGFGHVESEEQPKHLGALVGDNNAAKIVAETRWDRVEDGRFWESADAIVACCFDGTTDHETAKKMVRRAARILARAD